MSSDVRPDPMLVFWPEKRRPVSVENICEGAPPRRSRRHTRIEVRGCSNPFVSFPIQFFSLVLAARGCRRPAATRNAVPQRRRPTVQIRPGNFAFKTPRNCFASAVNPAKRGWISFAQPVGDDASRVTVPRVSIKVKLYADAVRQRIVVAVSDNWHARGE